MVLKVWVLFALFLPPARARRAQVGARGKGDRDGEVVGIRREKVACGGTRVVRFGRERRGRSRRLVAARLPRLKRRPVVKERDGALRSAGDLRRPFTAPPRCVCISVCVCVVAKPARKQRLHFASGACGFAGLPFSVASEVSAR